VLGYCLLHGQEVLGGATQRRSRTAISTQELGGEVLNNPTRVTMSSAVMSTGMSTGMRTGMSTVDEYSDEYRDEYSEEYSEGNSDEYSG
jgi:hypothetical protein